MSASSLSGGKNDLLKHCNTMSFQLSLAAEKMGNGERKRAMRNVQKTNFAMYSYFYQLYHRLTFQFALFHSPDMNYNTRNVESICHGS